MCSRHTPPPLSIQVVPTNGKRTLVLTGEVDLSTAPQLEAAIRDLCVEGASEVVLDLRGVSFMDSTGIEATLTAQELCARHGYQYAVVPGPRQVQRLFEITGLIDRLPFRVDTVA